MLEVYRKELKYLVNLQEVYLLKPRLAQVMKTDMHNGQDGYRVRSLYFDSVLDTDFEDKVDGYDKRRKIRLRIYDTNTDVIKLEVKEKEGSLQRKRSLSVSREEAERMIKADYSFLLERPEPIAHSLYTWMVTRGYRPKCIVEYDRLAYYVEHNDTRITFDSGLRATEADLDLFHENMVLYPVSEIGTATMEVKYNGFLVTYVKQIINKSDKVQVSNSKYCRARQITKRGRM